MKQKKHEFPVPHPSIAPETPLPWAVDPDWNGLTANGEAIFRTEQDTCKGAKMRDLEYMMHACNCFPFMLQAMKDQISYRDFLMSTHVLPEITKEVWDTAQVLGSKASKSLYRALSEATMEKWEY